MRFTLGNVPSCVCPLAAAALTFMVMRPVGAETWTLLSDTDFEGAARWSLLEVKGEGTSGWRESGWMSRFSSASDPDGTLTFNNHDYQGLADVGTRLWGLRNDGSSWKLIGFDRLGRADGAAVTLQGVSPSSRAYRAIAGDESSGDLYLFRDSGGWTADRFLANGTLAESNALSFGEAGVDYQGWARSSTGFYFALLPPQDPHPHRVAAFWPSGNPMFAPLVLRDPTSAEMRIDRNLKGFCASSTPLPDPSELMGPFLNGAFSGVASNPVIEPVDLEAVDAYPNLIFTEPSAMIPDPSGQRFFIAERPGIISWITTNESTTQKNVMLDISNAVSGGGEVASNSWESGLYNIVTHPDFAENGFLYACYLWTPSGNDIQRSEVASRPDVGHHLRLSRFTVDLQTRSIDPNSELVMIHIKALSSSHKGGGLAFGGDGFLYWAIGDMKEQDDATSISDNFRGGIVRLDVDQKGGAISHAPIRRMGIDAGQASESSGTGYFIPNDNGFNNPDGSVFEEFCALGHRQPYRLSYDPPTGEIWLAEVGTLLEEITILDPTGGRNGQWPYDEGYDDNPNGAPDGILGVEIPALYEFSRSQARSLIGGFIYRGSRFPALAGKYLASDWGTGSSWGSGDIMEVTYERATGQVSHRAIANRDLVVGFGQDPYNGNIFLLSGRPNGTFTSKIGKLVPVGGEGPTPQPQREPPSLLSKTGAFLDLASLEPTPGLLPFEPIAPLWSDGAAKKRWIALPSDGRRDSPLFECATFSETGNYDVPVGTVLIKHFEIGTRRIETRFMILEPNREWTALTYKWRPDGSEADLVGVNGETIQFTEGGQTYEWTLPGRADCFLCHTEASNFILGFRTRQLNSDFDYGDTVQNQLLWLQEREFFDDPIDPADLVSYLTAANLADHSAPLEQRVRSYLDSNCATCHQPGGNDGQATWNGLLTASLEESGLIYGTVGTTINNPTYEHIVVPRYPNLSHLYLRLEAGNGCCSMPPIAVNITDDAAREVVAQWILTLDQLPTGTASGFLRPERAWASSTWNGGGPGGGATSDATLPGNPGQWVTHLIQEPGTAIGDPDLDVTLNAESPAATHPADSGGADFGQWHDDAEGGSPDLIFDLGSSSPLQTIHIWQGNQAGQYSRGVQQFDVRVSDNAAAWGNPNHASWSEAVSNATLERSNGGAITARNFDLTGHRGRYVHLKIETNHGNAYTGLSEVRFTVLQSTDDSDGDGFSNSEEGLDDADGDGLPNLFDLYSDGDDVADEIEGNADFDGDNIPDYLDPDNDNDGIPDALECLDGNCDPDRDTIDSRYDLDSDGNGIPDAIEAASDIDGDGFTGLEELLFGTDPELAISLPAFPLTAPVLPSDAWSVNLLAIPDRIYTLEGTTDPRLGWQDLRTLDSVPQAGPVTLADPVSSESRNDPRFFYRVRVEFAPR